MFKKVQLNSELESWPFLDTKPDPVESGTFESLQPERIGFYSVLANGDFDDSAKCMKYFRQPDRKQFPLYLDVGVECIKPDYSSPDIMPILRYILAHKLYAPSLASISNTHMLPYDIVTPRRILQCIMATPNDVSPWSMRATRFKGTTYIFPPDETTPLDTSSRRSFKLKQHCFVDQPMELPRTNEPVGERPRFCCVFRLNMASNLRILYDGRVDGIVSDKLIEVNSTDLSSLEFIMLRTKDLRFAKQILRFNKCKSCYWWCQTQLDGSRQICRGMLDKDGYVNGLEFYKAVNFWKGKPWRCATSIDFLKIFLAKIQELLADVDDPAKVFEFHFDGKAINYRQIVDNADAVFLKDWYTAAFN